MQQWTAQATHSSTEAPSATQEACVSPCTCIAKLHSAQSARTASADQEIGISCRNCNSHTPRTPSDHHSCTICRCRSCLTIVEIGCDNLRLAKMARRGSAGFQQDIRRYLWSSKLAIAVVFFSAQLASGCDDISSISSTATVPLAHRGRQLTAFEVEALGGPVSQNCSAAPWRVSTASDSIHHMTPLRGPAR